jgi:hypothetical protein
MSFKGWAPVREQRGLLVAYATEPGNVTVDQSINAKALAEEIVKQRPWPRECIPACAERRRML